MTFFRILRPKKIKVLHSLNNNIQSLKICWKVFWLVFVVPQVDGEGYLLSDAFVNAVINSYKKDSMKTLAKQFAPDCVTKGNARAEGKRKSNRFSSNHSVRIYALNYFLFLDNVAI